MSNNPVRTEAEKAQDTRLTAIDQGIERLRKAIAAVKNPMLSRTMLLALALVEDLAERFQEEV